jgi:hypothetical protein
MNLLAFLYLNSSLLIRHIIDLDNLDAESITYWKWLCDRAKNNGDDDNCLDLILPSLTEFCEYIRL